MPLRHVRLTPEEQEYVTNTVASGRFSNAGELVQAALCALKREERARRERALKAKSEEEETAISSPWIERNAFATLIRFNSLP
jgi:putative addiction module CopG family antidote